MGYEVCRKEEYGKTKMIDFSPWEDRIVRCWDLQDWGRAGLGGRSNFGLCQFELPA